MPGGCHDSPVLVGWEDSVQLHRFNVLPCFLTGTGKPHRISRSGRNPSPSAVQQLHTELGGFRRPNNHRAVSYAMQLDADRVHGSAVV
jgi:hypothetical protein